MNHRDIAALMAGIAPVLKDYVANAVAGFSERISALEAREPLKGEKGDAGEAGKDGTAGRDGFDGKDGSPGRDGVDGKDGKDGSPGERGGQGDKGHDGAAGKDGEPGRDGQPGGAGAAGRDGIDGKDGAPGRDGLDGLGFDDLQVTHDGERGITLRFARGDQVKEFSFTLPIVIDRGVWREGSHKHGDGVTWGGSFWIAQKDTDTKPGTPNSDWRLAVKRGADGKDGKNGLKGDAGPRGEPGKNAYVA